MSMVIVVIWLTLVFLDHFDKWKWVLHILARSFLTLYE